MLRKAALRQLIHRPMTTLLMILIMGDVYPKNWTHIN